MMKPSMGASQATILVTKEDHARLGELKQSPFEPFWSVVHRLIDEHAEKQRKKADGGEQA